MRLYNLIIVCAVAAPAAGLAEEAEATSPEQTEPAYVVREEKVVNFATGKVETEKVIEFPEIRILPELSRPVEIIIPRTKPDFDYMPFTIYNNEPASCLPEEYRLRYYRRFPVDNDTRGDIKTGDMFRPPEAEGTPNERSDEKTD